MSGANGMIRLQGLSIGPPVDVIQTARGFVHSVFEHAVNLDMSGCLWTLLAEDRADLPLGIRVGVRDFSAIGFSVGGAVNIRSGFVGIGSIKTECVIDCRSAQRWRPAYPARIEPGLMYRLALIEQEVHGRSWRRSPEMARAIEIAAGSRNGLYAAVTATVGRGPGLTPAGDDVLVGMLAVLSTPFCGSEGAEFAKTLSQIIPRLLRSTTDISRQLLRQAMNGQFARTLHELIANSIEDRGQQKLRETITSILRTGATSGADTCEGILALAPKFLASFDEKVAT